MVFNSLEFALFLPIVFALYWYVFNKSAKSQNILLLGASVFFYCLADWKFISLLAISGLINYYLAIAIAKNEEGKIRRALFYLGIVINVGTLLYFKYFNFFIENFVALFNSLGAEAAFTPFHILLPLGISFFTFQMIGYLIDVNNEEIEPTNDLLSFATYLAYFPKILSGPIERIQNFLPQTQKKREFDYGLAVDGARQFLWGLFKKLIIADTTIPVVNSIFENAESMNGSTLFLGAIFYIVSLYADFSGYSDMACGVSKLFGITITNNFAFPFFSRNISDFWKKWHISLTSWMMDYVFTPLNFMLRGYKQKGLILSIVITFLIVGLWHGANWTFIVFGILNGLYFIPIILKGSMNRQGIISKNALIPTFKELIEMLGLFILVALTSIFFKSSSVENAFIYISRIFGPTLFKVPARDTAHILLIIIGFLIFEWFGRHHEHALKNGLFTRKNYRIALYYLLVILMLFFNGENEQFIYFQF